MRYLIPLRHGRGVPSLVAVVLVVLLILFVLPLLSWQDKTLFTSWGLRVVLALTFFLGWSVYYLARYGAHGDEAQFEAQVQLRQQRRQRLKARRALDRWLRQLRGRSPWRRSRAQSWWLALTTDGDQAAAIIQQLWPVRPAESLGEGWLKAFQAPEIRVLAADVQSESAGEQKPAGEQESAGEQLGRNWRLLARRIRRHRTGVPLQGLVLLLRVADLKDVDCLQTISCCLQDVLAETSDNVPIYLTLTDLHQLPGLGAFAASLGRSEQQQLFGVSLPVTAKGNRSILVVEALAQLQQRLQSMLTRALYQERQLARRRQIMAFPGQFDLLCNQLTDALNYCLPASGRVLLRGIHFTGHASVVPESSLPPNSWQGTASGSPATWVFVQRWWHDFLAGDRALAHWTPAQRRSRWFAGTTAGFALTVLFGAMVVWQVQGYRAGQQRLDQVKQTLSRQEMAMEQTGRQEFALHQVLALVRLWAGARQTLDQATPWLGMGDVEPLVRPISDYQQRLLREALLPLVANRAEAILATEQDPESLMTALRIYLMLAQPEKREIPLLANWFAGQSQDLLQGRGFSQQWLQSRVQEAFAREPGALAVDQELIHRVRAQLNRIPREQQLYLRIKQAARYQSSEGFRYGTQLGVEGATTFEGSQFEIPALFTLQGHNRIFAPELNRLLNQYEEERWILGAQDAHPSGEDLSRLRRLVQQSYADDYVRYWQTALHQLRLVRAYNLEHLVGLLNALTAPSSPLKLALEATSEHTNYSLTAAAETLSEQSSLTNAVGGSTARLAQKAGRVAKAVSQLDDQAVPDYLLNIRERFQAMHRLVPAAGETAALAPLLAQLGKLQHDLSVLASGNSQEAVFRAVAQRFQSGGTDSLAQLQIIGRQLPEPVRSWVLDLADQVWTAMLQQTQEHIAIAYYEGVKLYFERHLQGRYPLVPTAKTEANFEHFSEFFGPEGVTERYVRDYLTPFIETGRSQWRARQIDGRGLRLNPELLQQFQRAQRVRQAWFDSDQGLQIKLVLRPLFLDANVSRFEMRLDDQRLSYRHGPQRPVSLVWPASRSLPGVGVLFEDYNGVLSKRSFEGNWSLPRLLDQFEVETVQDGGPYQVGYELDGRRVVYSLQGGSDLQILLRRELQKYRVPDLTGG